MTAPDPAGCDVAVIGGGIVGLAVAHELGRRGQAVVVLERADLAGVATRAAAGMLAPSSEAEVADRALIELGLDSLGRYPAFVADLEAATGIACEYRTEGTLWVALHRDHEAELTHVAALQRAKGVATERLSADQVLAREPHLAPRVVGGLLAVADHQVDPRRVVQALETAIVRRGGRVLTGRRVTRIDAARGRVRAVAGLMEDRPFEVAAGVAVLAAGAWSGEIAGPVPPLGLRPVKGQVVRLRGAPLLRHVVRTPDVYLVPRRDGELVIGATMEEQGFETTPRAGSTRDLLREAWRVLPGIDDLAVAELSVGLRPALRDHLPAIGATATAGLFVATGHFRDGVLLAPATAHYLTELIVSGISPAALAPFAVGRLVPSPARLRVAATGREGAASPVAGHGP